MLSINYFYTLTPLFLRQCNLRWMDKRLHSFFHPYIKYQLFLHSCTPIFRIYTLFLKNIFLYDRAITMIHQWVYEITMIHRRLYELTMIHQWVYELTIIHQWVYDPSNWKVFKGDKVWKTSKIFNLKSYFSIWSSKKSTPQPGVLKSC